ncbi:hypothetical protein [Streptosporangium sp. CA-115845]|uniref:hypothetical protein n=1 Tax=Streptosporangium sp. CA-115845 TaxID=3240071 RepID=UPI003D8EC812
MAGGDLRIMIYTAEPGTEDAERLALLTVPGTQALIGRSRYGGGTASAGRERESPARRGAACEP